MNTSTIQFKSLFITCEKVTDGGMSNKYWILPSGEVLSFGSEFHYSYLLNNTRLMKKLGIDPGDESEDTVRKNALKKGLFRVNYEKKGMNLVIEGLHSMFTKKVKDAIFDLVGTVGGLNNITVNLYDDGITRLAKGATTNVGNYSGVEIADHIPFVTESTESDKYVYSPGLKDKQVKWRDRK